MALPRDRCGGASTGWAVDAGLDCILPLDWEPRLYAGYARGSGDPTPETDSDRSFRRTGLEANEAGIGVFLEIVPATGDIVQLVGCNVDRRCAALPAP